MSQKWAILLLQHELADSTSQHTAWSRPEGQLKGKPLPINGIESNPSPRDDVKPTVLTKAFSVAGLAQLPSHENQRKPNRSTPADEDQRHHGRRECYTEPPAKFTEAEHYDDLPATPTESTLLHDLPFTLQGLSSAYLPFSSLSTVNLPSSIPLPVISLLHTLAEPSLLYRVLSEFVDSRDEGLVGQSLRSAMSTELRAYLGLIATLEGEIRRAIASTSSSGPRGGIAKSGVTLKRCVVWTREATMGLRLMSLMAEEAKSTSIACAVFILLTMHREKRRPADLYDSHLLIILRRSICRRFRRANAGPSDKAFLRYATPMDL